MVIHLTENQFRVIPIQFQDITQNGTFILYDPEDTKASRNGWVYQQDTEGNNAVGTYTLPRLLSQMLILITAYKGEGTNYAHWTSLLAFDYSYDTFTQPDTNTNADFAKVNAFYIVNTVHDITYRYGFTEEAFNFQNYNFRTSVSL